MLGLEHVVDEALPLMQVERIVECGDAGRVLPPVLKGGEADNHICHYVIGTVKTYYSAHGASLKLKIMKYELKIILS